MNLLRKKILSCITCSHNSIIIFFDEVNQLFVLQVFAVHIFFEMPVVCTNIGIEKKPFPPGYNKLHSFTTLRSSR